MFIRWSLVGFVMVAVLVSGCPPSRVPVQGVLRLDGKPVEGALVTLAPDGSNGPSFTGKSDVSGKFDITGGAPPGNYRVLAYKHNDGPNPVGSTLPAIYMDHKTTPLKCTVPSPTPVEFNLKSDN